MFKLTKFFGVEWAGVFCSGEWWPGEYLGGLLWEWLGSWEAGRKNKQGGNALQAPAFSVGTQAGILLLQADGKTDMAPWGPLRQMCRQPTWQLRFLQQLPCLSGTWGLALTPLCTRVGSASPSVPDPWGPQEFCPSSWSGSWAGYTHLITSN